MIFKLVSYHNNLIVIFTLSFCPKSSTFIPYHVTTPDIGFTYPFLFFTPWSPWLIIIHQLSYHNHHSNHRTHHSNQWTNTTTTVSKKMYLNQTTLLMRGFSFPFTLFLFVKSFFSLHKPNAPLLLIFHKPNNVHYSLRFFSIYTLFFGPFF